jgi:hypothetical protein
MPILNGTVFRTDCKDGQIICITALGMNDGTVLCITQCMCFQVEELSSYV